MIDIALTTEFALAAGGARWAAGIGSSGGRPRLRCLASRRLRHTSTPSIWCGRMVSLGWTAHMVPLTVDGLIYASSIVVLDSARREAPVSGAGAMAAWPGHCGAARGQRGPWGGAQARWCGGGRMVGGRTGRLL